VPTMLNSMNQKAMMDLLLTGRRIRAEEAVRLGIITRAVPPARLDAELNEVLEHLSRGSAAAIRKSKQFVRDCETLTYREGIKAATEKHIHGLANPETKAGLAAFADKRKASWS
jgi:enoyl-CoA hydratase/carnithine racemase